MKVVFILAFALCIGLYLTAQATLPKPARDGIIRIRWATDANPARNRQTNLFDELNPGLEVRVDPGLGGDQTKLIVQCATGTGPDIIDVYSKEQMATLVEAGILMDLTPYAEEMGFGADRTYPSLSEGLMVEGRQYRFPCNVWSNCIIYNKAIFDDHGVPYPKDGWTWDDFVATAQALRDSPSKSDQKQLAFANWQPASVFGEAYWNLGGRYFASDGLTSMLDSREAIQAMQLYYDLVHVHHAIPTVAELTNVSAQGGWGSGGLTIFSREGAAMIIIGRWYIILMPDYPNLRDKLGAVRLPRFADRPMTGMTDTRAAGVNAMSPHRMEALSFLTYLAGADYSSLIVEDGDSLPPNPLLATSGEALATKTVPDPAFHQPFVDAQRDSRPIDISSFIDAVLIDRWIGERIDQVENKLTSPEDAMRGLAQEVNQTIRRNLEREPRLQRKYKEITGQDYHPDWWKTHKAPAA